MTAPYVDATTGKLTITFAEPISESGTLTAIVGTDMHLDSVTRKVNGIRATNKSFAFLLDDAGNILAYANAELVLKPATAIAPAPSSPTAGMANPASPKAARWKSCVGRAGNMGCAILPTAW